MQNRGMTLRRDSESFMELHNLSKIIFGIKQNARLLSKEFSELPRDAKVKII